MLNILETQKKLVSVALPSGYEMPQAKVLEALAKPFVDEMYYDTLGNLICVKKGKAGGKKVMMPAHMDVIGFVVTFIDKNGFIRFAPIGGHLPAMLISTPVRFENGIQGCIQASDKVEYGKPVGAVSILDLYIDIGAKDYDEAAALVKVGDVAVFDSQPALMAGGNMMTPYADDLAACIVLLIAMEELKGKECPNDLYFVFSVQEERGLLGAKVAAYHIQPDMGIAVDLTRTGDTPGETVKMEVSLGKGPTVKIKDSSFICSPQVVNHLRDAAKKAKIPYQNEVLLAGGTDGAAMQRSRGGVVSGVISIPGRNIHTHGEIVNLKDVELAGKLMAQAVMMEINF